jgi:hypothetical protein
MYSLQCSQIERGAWTDFQKTLSANYIGKNMQGPPDTRASEPKSIRDLMQALGLHKCSVQLLGSHSNGGVATAEVLFTLSGHAVKTTRRIHKGDSIALTFHSADAWQMEGQKLLQTRASTLGMKMFRNGALIVSRGV